MKNFWVSAYSPLRDNVLFVRSCGHCCVDSSHREKVRRVDYANFYWCVEGSGYFKFKDKYCKIQPEDVWYMPYDSWHDFYPGKEGFHYYWLSFEGKGWPMIEQMLKLVHGKKFCGTAPNELFRQILAGLRHLTPERRLEIMGIAFQILFQIASAPTLSSEHEKNIALEAKELMEREFTNPSFNVNRLAELLTVHRVTLCREFKKAFRISPGAYLKGCRLRKAVEMLSQHRYTIKEIAFSCGFSSQEYFATVFHSEFGHTPSTF